MATVSHEWVGLSALIVFRSMVPGAMPQAGMKAAPLALNTCQKIGARSDPPPTTKRSFCRCVCVPKPPAWKRGKKDRLARLTFPARAHYWFRLRPFTEFDGRTLHYNRGKTCCKHRNSDPHVAKSALNRCGEISNAVNLWNLTGPHLVEWTFCIANGSPADLLKHRACPST